MTDAEKIQYMQGEIDGLTKLCASLVCLLAPQSAVPLLNEAARTAEKVAARNTVPITDLGQAKIAQEIQAALKVAGLAHESGEAQKH